MDEAHTRHKSTEQEYDEDVEVGNVSEADNLEEALNKARQALRLHLSGDKPMRLEGKICNKWLDSLPAVDSNTSARPKEGRMHEIGEDIGNRWSTREICSDL